LLSGTAGARLTRGKGLEGTLEEGRGDMETRETVREAILPSALAPVSEDDRASLFELGIIDSFGLMDVINRLEAAFDVKVPDSDLTPKKFETVAKMVAYFDSKRT
jgi:acyl carrier protein